MLELAPRRINLLDLLGVLRSGLQKTPASEGQRSGLQKPPASAGQRSGLQEPSASAGQRSGLQKPSESSGENETIFYQCGTQDISIASVRSLLLSKVNMGQLPNMLLYSVYSTDN